MQLHAPPPAATPITARIAAPPIDWLVIESHYRAGVLSLAAIGKQFGVSAPGILKHMRKRGINRDLRRLIAAKTEEKVNARLVHDRVNAEPRLAAQAEVVAATSELAANVALAHRADLVRLRRLAGRFLTELECMLDAAEVLRSARAAIAPNARGASQKTLQLAETACSLPRRLDSLRKLVEIERTIISTERTILGLDQQVPDASTSFEDLVDLATAALASSADRPLHSLVVPTASGFPAAARRAGETNS